MSDSHATRAAAVGAPVDRVDGRAKVTGAARYAAELPLPGLAHAVMVDSAVARGRVRALDTAAAERAPGVLAVVTHRNAPRLAPAGKAAGDATVPMPEGGAAAGPADGDVFSRPRAVLQSPEVAYRGQTVALVVAETLDAARRGAELVRAEYNTPEPPALGLEAHREGAFVPARLLIPLPPETAQGDFAGAYAAAPARLDAEYRHPIEHHNPMELAATTAAWDAEERLFAYDATQDVNGTRRTLAKSFGLAEEKVRVVAPFLGGGFGGKHPARDHTVLAALAARAVGRPVRLVATRQQMFTAIGHRPESIQRIRLAADRDGRLLALEHDILVATSADREFVEHIGAATGVMYACANRHVVHRAVALNLRLPTIMRAPGETPGMFALESAMDEMAQSVGLDPIELRRRNEPDREPARGLPLSSRALLRCFDEGAGRFGWQAARAHAPRTRRDGRWLVGTGTAGATYPTSRLQASARAVLLADGGASVATQACDIGTGAYTVLAQVAADALGLPVGRVAVALADTALPAAPGAGGSWTTASVAPAVAAACAAARARLAALAVADAASPLRGLPAEALELRGGRLSARGDPGRGEAVGALLARHRLGEIAAEAETRPDPEAARRHAMHAFGAVFAEVGVDEDTGEARVRRMLGVYGCGRILNPKTARSQMIGGMVWGIGQALTEEGVVDTRPHFGHVVNADLAEYHVPVHADVPALDVLFLDEHDPHVNPLGAKGVGEIGIVGVAPAIANAVHHATGRRVRSLPITLDKLL